MFPVSYCYIPQYCITPLSTVSHPSHATLYPTHTTTHLHTLFSGLSITPILPLPSSPATTLHFTECHSGCALMGVVVHLSHATLYAIPHNHSAAYTHQWSINHPYLTTPIISSHHFVLSPTPNQVSPHMPQAHVRHQTMIYFHALVLLISPKPILPWPPTLALNTTALHYHSAFQYITLTLYTITPSLLNVSPITMHHTNHYIPHFH